MSTVERIIRAATNVSEQNQKELLAMAKGMEAALKMTREEALIAHSQTLPAKNRE